MDVRIQGRKGYSPDFTASLLLQPHNELCWWKAVEVKWIRSTEYLLSVFSFFPSPVFNNGASWRYEHRLYSRHPRIHCTRGEISDCMPFPSPKILSLCNIDGMRALLLIKLLEPELLYLSFSSSLCFLPNLFVSLWVITLLSPYRFTGWFTGLSAFHLSTIVTTCDC